MLRQQAAPPYQWLAPTVIIVVTCALSDVHRATQAAGPGSSTPSAAAESVAPQAGSPAGIDVSHFQGTVDWQKVRQAGIAFAIAKATQGDGYEDPMFRVNWPAMKAAGLIRGAYDFYDVADDPATQAREFISRVSLEAGDLPPVVDIETMNGAADTIAGLAADLRTYLDLLSAHYGVKPIIYTGPGFWNAHVNESFGDFPLWVAVYADAIELPHGWSTWTIWQHSQTGTIEGVDGAVDLDRFNGDREALEALTLAAP